jgi:hypothetical protein
MRIQFLAGCVLLATIGCTVNSVAPNDARVMELASLQRIGGTPNVTSFRLRNLTAHSLEYVHWLGGGAEPVPYCKSADGSISVCGEKGRPDEELFTHEMALKAGRSVTFEVQNVNSVSVGVLLLLDGQGQYIWSENVAQQAPAADAGNPRG